MPNKFFGPTYKDEAGDAASYPEEMRTQLWPLCCGARILSGLKHAHSLTEEELVAEINTTINDVFPDHQVFAGERMMPKHIFLTLNDDQMNSSKIMSAIAKVGFIKIGTGRPRGSAQGFFLLDQSETFTTETVKNGKAA